MSVVDGPPHTAPELTTVHVCLPPAAASGRSPSLTTFPAHTDQISTVFDTLSHTVSGRWCLPVIGVILRPRQLVVDGEGEAPLERDGVPVKLDQQALVQVARAALEAQLVRDAHLGAHHRHNRSPRDRHLQPALDARHRHHVCVKGRRAG